MTLQELAQILKSTGYPVAYSHFKKDSNTPPPRPPFICYVVAYSSNFFADDRVHKKIDQVQVELYTTIKDLEAEKKVETALENAGLVYETTETFIESEQLFQKIYEIGVV